MRSARENRHREIMEGLTGESKAIYEALRRESAEYTAALEARLVAIIEASIQASLTAAVKDMKVYTDGAEQELRHELADLRTALDPGARSTDAIPHIRTPRGAESGPDGHRGSSSTRGTERPAAALHVPPPARGIRDNSALLILT